MSEPQQKYTSMDMVMTGHLIKRLVSERSEERRVGKEC